MSKILLKINALQGYLKKLIRISVAL